MSTIQVDTILAQDGTTTTEPSIPALQKSFAKAWAHFNGSTGAITQSYNISSIVKNGTGDYTVNFENAMANAAYAATGGGSYEESFFESSGFLTTSIEMLTKSSNGTVVNPNVVTLIIFGE